GLRAILAEGGEARVNVAGAMPDLEAVGDEGEALEHGAKLRELDEASPGDLRLLEHDGAVPIHLVDGDEASIVGAETEVIEKPAWLRAPNPELFGDLACRGRVRLLARADDSADEHVVEARKDILRHRASVDVDASSRIEAEDADAAMEEISRAHLVASSRADPLPLEIDEVDELVPRGASGLERDVVPRAVDGRGILFRVGARRSVGGLGHGASRERLEPWRRFWR